MSCGVGSRRGSELVLLWLWHGLAAVAPIRTLAWELTYAADVALKRPKKPKQEKKKKKLEYQNEREPLPSNKKGFSKDNTKPKELGGTAAQKGRCPLAGSAGSLAGMGATGGTGKTACCLLLTAAKAAGASKAHRKWRCSLAGGTLRQGHGSLNQEQCCSHSKKRSENSTVVGPRDLHEPAGPVCASLSCLESIHVLLRC